jgi:hypothetical protein
VSRTLWLPNKDFSQDHDGHRRNAQAIEDWGRDLESRLASHAASHALDGTDPATAFPIMLGRVINHIASNWGINNTHGWNPWAGTADDANGGLAITITKKRADTILRVIYGYNIHSTVNAGAFQQSLFDVTASTRHDIMNKAITLSAAFEHPEFTGQAFLTGKAAGSRTLTLQIQATTGGYEIHTDSNDSGWMEVWEVPGNIVNTVMP